MRKPQLFWNDAEALALLEKAETVHLASTDDTGMPVLRALHAVLVDGVLAFHGAKAGEKGLCLGRPAVVSAHRVVGQIPSFFVDPRLACPATTYYESVQVKGDLVEIKAVERKEKVIAALMKKYQPEGGYVAIDAEDPLYRKALKGLLVYGIKIETITGKRKIGQNRSKEEMLRIFECLWERGEPTDLLTIDLISQARHGNGEERPDFLQAPHGTVFCCQMGEQQNEQVVALLKDAYWNQEVTDEQIAEVHTRSEAWVGIVDAKQQVIASARAVSDGIKFSWILDVVVAESWRGKGLGSALMSFLLKHPRLRACCQIGLGTKDAQSFYEVFGFKTVRVNPVKGTHEMILYRQPS